jgi:hypothetical protein
MLTILFKTWERIYTLCCAPCIWCSNGRKWHYKITDLFEIPKKENINSQILGHKITGKRGHTWNLYTEFSKIIFRWIKKARKKCSFDGYDNGEPGLRVFLFYFFCKWIRQRISYPSHLKIYLSECFTLGLLGYEMPCPSYATVRRSKNSDKTICK